MIPKRIQPVVGKLVKAVMRVIKAPPSPSGRRPVGLHAFGLGRGRAARARRAASVPVVASPPPKEGRVSDSEEPRCNICDTPRSQFEKQGRRERVRCPKCGSLEAHRALGTVFGALTAGQNLRGARVLVVRPRPATSRLLCAVAPRAQLVVVYGPPSDWARQIPTGETGCPPRLQEFDGAIVPNGLLAGQEEAYLSELHRLLKPGGLAVLAQAAIPNSDDQFRRRSDAHGVSRTHRVLGELQLLRLAQAWFLVRTFDAKDPATGSPTVLYRLTKDPRTAETRDAFARALAKRYGAPPEYARRLLRERKCGYCSLDEFDAEPNERKRRWLINRMRAFRDARLDFESVAPAVTNDGATKTSLDIGCGIGILTETFAQRGWNAVGIDLGQEVARLRKLLLDSRTAEFIDADFLTRDFGCRMFDAITAINVVEHIASVTEMARRAASLLTRGGALYLRIPNKDFILYFGGEPHTLLFGGSLLERAAFERYHHEALGREPDELYNYQGLEWYVERIREAGLEPETRCLPDDIRESAQLPNDISVAEESLSQFRATMKTRLSSGVFESVVEAAERYLVELRTSLAATDGNPNESFRLRYLAPSWRVLGIKR
jgi:2-polyprenyl-3-methyl-5-hydroxy-6-metoxy-1,4-benzoquinol methylase